MAEARDEVLGRIVVALGRGTGGPRGAAAGAPPRRTPARRHLGPDDPWETGLRGAGLVALLTERVLDYRASVTAATPADLDAVIATLLSGAQVVVVPAGLDPSWWRATAAAGVRVDVDRPGAAIGTAALDAVDAVITGSRLAIAETGTIVLDGSPDQGRRALSLVPDHHVCVVRSHDVVRGLPAAVRRLDLTRPLTWISGPSATSDIELDRVEGVHGPRRLDVVVLSG